MAEAQVLELRAKLDKVVAAASTDSTVVRDMLDALPPMTLELLRSTKVGKTLSALVGKAQLDAPTKKLAREKLAEWKALLVTPSRAPSSRPKTEVKSYKEPTEAEVIEAAEAAQERQVQSKTVGKVKIYKERQPLPKRDAKTRCFIFDDHPKFRPNMSPAEVLLAGSFGGGYFRPIRSKVTGKSYGDEVWQELPKDWLAAMSAADIRKKVCSASYNASVNTYKVKCGASLDEWESSGWITDSDPYGWFQWYCRFFQGRRCSDDDRQLARGLQCFGPTGRWRTNLMNKIIAGQGKRSLQQALDDDNISPVVRQTLQHWGYRLTLADLEAHIKHKFG